MHKEGASLERVHLIRCVKPVANRGEKSWEWNSLFFGRSILAPAR